MSAKYGAIEVNEKIVENAKEVDVDVEINLSDPRKRRRWWRVNQNMLFGLGHVYNDLCAAMWFSYMMLFFQAVLAMRAVVAGAMMLLGQVVDALATPVVGILADKYSTKKSWHLTGCILVTCTFPLLFIRCWGCWMTGDDEANYLSWWMPFYYATIIVFFQIGWAIVQISHLSMIPTISECLQVRSELTSIRYMASVTSSLMVYLITWIVLRATNYSTFIGATDDYKFRDVSLIISGIGITSFTLFHVLFKLTPRPESKNNGHAVNNGASLLIAEEEPVKLHGKSKIVHFLQMPLLYQTSLLYVFSRLYWALSLVYVPLFLEERLSVNPSAGSELVASVPLVLYISSFFFSLILKSKISSCGNQGMVHFIPSKLNNFHYGINIEYLLEKKSSSPHFFVETLIMCINEYTASMEKFYNTERNTKQYMQLVILVAYLIGSFLSLISSLWIALAIDPQASIVQIYLVATLIGAGSSITLVSSLCVTADLIGPHSHQGAAIYSIVTFADKLVTGIAVVAIENYKCEDATDCPQYYRGVLAYACGGSALLGIIALSYTRLTTSYKPRPVT